MTEISQLTSAVLALPLAERIQLAQALWASLETDTNDEACDAHAEALRTAEKRDAELTSGTVQGISHADVIAEARKSLGCE